MPWQVVVINLNNMECFNNLKSWSAILQLKSCWPRFSTRQAECEKKVFKSSNNFYADDQGAPVGHPERTTSQAGVAPVAGESCWPLSAVTIIFKATEIFFKD